MKHLLKNAGDAAVYCFLLAAGSALHLLPSSSALWVAQRCGGLLYILSAWRRRVAIRNLDIAYRDQLPLAEKKRIARKSFEHAMACAAGFVLRESRVWSLDSFEISDESEKALAGPHPEGIAFLSAHLGDWEMAHHYLGLRGLPAAIVTRHVSNSFLEGEINRRRSRRGSSTIPKRGALTELKRLLGQGLNVGVLADQNCPSRENFFEHFGTLASSYIEYARVMVRFQARVIFMVCLRKNEPMRYEIIARDLGKDLPLLPDLPKAERARRRADALVRSYLSTVEELMRLHPEQGFWMHRRWKSRPTGAPWLYHDLGKPMDLSLLSSDAGRGTPRAAASE